MIPKLCKSLSLAVLCQAALVSICSHREIVKNYKYTRTRQALSSVRVASTHAKFLTMINSDQSPENVMSYTEEHSINCHRKQNKKLESQK